MCSLSRVIGWGMPIAQLLHFGLEKVSTRQKTRGRWLVDEQATIKRLKPLNAENDNVIHAEFGSFGSKTFMSPVAAVA